MTCGCGEPENDHGDPANLVLNRFVEAAEAASVTLEEAVANVQETYDQLTDASS